MDDTQRIIAATFGVGLMLGAIAWVAVVSLSSTKFSWGLRVLVPLAMFVLGALIVVWAWRGPSNQPCRLLTKAIADGHALLCHLDPQRLVASSVDQQRQHWEARTFDMLRDQFGLATAQNFQAVVHGNHPAIWVTAMVEFLEKLKKNRCH